MKNVFLKYIFVLVVLSPVCSFAARAEVLASCHVDQFRTINARLLLDDVFGYVLQTSVDGIDRWENRWPFAAEAGAENYKSNVVATTQENISSNSTTLTLVETEKNSHGVEKVISKMVFYFEGFGKSMKPISGKYTVNVPGRPDYEVMSFKDCASTSLD